MPTPRPSPSKKNIATIRNASPAVVQTHGNIQSGDIPGLLISLTDALQSQRFEAQKFLDQWFIHQEVAVSNVLRQAQVSERHGSDPHPEAFCLDTAVASATLTSEKPRATVNSGNTLVLTSTLSDRLDNTENAAPRSASLISNLGVRFGKASQASQASAVSEPGGTRSPSRNKRWTFSEAKQRLHASQKGHGSQEKILGSNGSSDQILRKSSWRESGHSSLAGRIIGGIVHTRPFEIGTALAIIASSVLVGVEVEYGATTGDPDSVPEAFNSVFFIFSCVFVLELSMRIAAAGPVAFFYWSYAVRWNLFDTVLVFISLVDMVITNAGGAPTKNLLLTIRITRVLRLVRIIRLVRFLGGLRIMIFSVINTLRALFWSMVLMAILLYLFGTVLTQGSTYYIASIDRDSQEAQEVHRHFGNITVTVLTLFKSMTGGEDWGRPMEALLKLPWLYPALFLVFISFMVFTILNVITGFFCESAIESASRDRDSMIAMQIRDKERHTTEFRRIFERLDSDGSGDLTINELERHFQDEAVQAYFANLNLDIERAWDIFKLLDDDSSGTVSVEEFVAGCLRLRGHAKTIDVTAIAYDLQRLMRKQSIFMSFVEKELNKLMPPGNGNHPPQNSHSESRFPSHLRDHSVNSGC